MDVGPSPFCVTYWRGGAAPMSSTNMGLVLVSGNVATSPSVAPAPMCSSTPRRPLRCESRVEARRGRCSPRGDSICPVRPEETPA